MMTTSERKKVTTALVLLLMFILSLAIVVTLLREDPERSEYVFEIEYALGAEDALTPFFSDQVMVRESMMSGLMTNDIEAFCDAYLEFMRISREPIIPIMPEGEELLIIGEKDGWVIRLLMIDWYLIPDLARLSGYCGWDFPYQGTTG